MATPILMDSEWRRSYSWWWDSHITPNNSKWLQHNLTDMDAKIEAMINLIEEDADSFAIRAEMFYQKRPDLMKLIEDFYRAYRALAERYDHATGELRQAHQTIIAQAFPDQVHPLAAAHDDDDSLHPHIHDEFSLEPKHAIIPETEVVVENLKKALADVQTDKESVLLNYRDTMKRLSDLDQEISSAQKNSVRLNDLAQEAETEAWKLKEELVMVEAERDDFLEKIAYLEEKLSFAMEESRRLKENAERAENHVRNLEMALAELNKEKDDAAIQYRNCLEKIRNLEDELERSNKSLQLEEVDDLGKKISMKDRELSEKGEDLEDKNYSLLLECRKYIEASKLAEKLINDLECENLEQQEEGEILLDEMEKMRLGMLKVFRALEVDVQNETEFSFLHVLGRIEDLKFSLVSYEDRSQHLSVENAVLLALLDGREVEKEKVNLNLGIIVMNEAVQQSKDNLENGEKLEEIVENVLREDNLEMWEAEAATFYFDFQLSNVREVLYESKVHELSESCEALEKETVSKTVEIEQIKERFVSMESEIGDLKAQLSAYAPIIDSMRNNIESLEHNVLEDAYLELHPSKEKNSPKDVQNRHLEEGVSELQKLQFRVEAVTRVLQKFPMRSMISNEITKPEIIESMIMEDLTKDIPLDQVSNSSSLRRTNNNVVRRIPRADDQMLALWEAAAEDCSFIHADASVPWDLKTEITETLAIDAEKLTKLKTTMLELRNKMEKLKKKKKNSVDFETMKEQFQEVDEAIVQFTCLNSQLKRNIKELVPSRSQTGMKRVYELAHNGSEGITRLELEVQKIQYVFLKQGEEKKSKGGLRQKEEKKKKTCLCGCFNPSSPTASPLTRLACDAHIVSGAVEWL